MEEMLFGSTDRTIPIFIADPASTDGSGKTGVAHTDLTVSYSRVETDNDVTVSDVTSSLNALTSLTDAHNDWGWKEVSSTLAPGLYRLDVADAVFASGAWYAVVYVMLTSSAASAAPKGFRLVAVNALDAVRMGMTALPNAAADAAGGLPISDAGGLDLDARLDAAITSRLAPTTAGRTLDVSAGGEAGIDWANVGNPTTTVGLSGTTVKAVTDGVNLDRINGTIAGVDGLKDLGANGYSIATNSVLKVTDVTNVTNLTNAATAGDLTAAMILSVTGAVPSSTTIKNDVAAQISADHGAGNYERNTEPLDAAATRTALGLGSANLDTQLADLPTVAEFNARTIAAVSYATATDLGTVDTVVDAIKVKTDQFVFTVANQVDANALSGGGSGLDAAGVRAAVGLASANLDTQLGAIDTVVDAVKAKTDQLVFTTANRVDSTTQSGVSTLTAAEVLAQVNAALDTAIAELGIGTPATTPTLRTGLMLLYMASLNNSEDTQTLRKIKNAAGTVIAQATITSSSSGVAQGKLVSP